MKRFKQFLTESFLSKELERIIEAIEYKGFNRCSMVKFEYDIGGIVFSVVFDMPSTIYFNYAIKLQEPHTLSATFNINKDEIDDIIRFIYDAVDNYETDKLPTDLTLISNVFNINGDVLTYKDNTIFAEERIGYWRRYIEILRDKTALRKYTLDGHTVVDTFENLKYIPQKITEELHIYEGEWNNVRQIPSSIFDALPDAGEYSFGFFSNDQIKSEISRRKALKDVQSDKESTDLFGDIFDM